MRTFASVLIAYMLCNIAYDSKQLQRQFSTENEFLGRCNMWRPRRKPLCQHLQMYARHCKRSRQVEITDKGDQGGQRSESVMWPGISRYFEVERKEWTDINYKCHMTSPFTRYTRPRNLTDQGSETYLFRPSVG